MDRQRGGESLEVKPSARAALVQFEPAERGEPADHRILNTDRCSDEVITGAIEGLPPYLRTNNSSTAKAKKEGDALQRTQKGRRPSPT